ncbi:MAG TPA: Gfo/Idh/MocA family oxidoreductase [Clostridia bacterium]|nr:Gfo/Idh/MocA family oxidoreductase [Clostridia bacterium]
MTEDISIVLVGIGGYGGVYLEDLLEGEPEEGIKIAGAVDPNPAGCKYLDQLKRLQIPIYESLEDFYAEHSADLAIISSPIHFHSPQTRLALSNGSNVLCEKPVSATIQEAREMAEARDKFNKFVAVGYQWSHSPVIHDLKKDIMEGTLGKPKILKTMVLWSRPDDYFNRSWWAGKIRDSSRNWILDSVANNATAHYLHNMFYVLGDAIDQSATPAEVTAELYRANAIENFDTAAIRAKTEEGTDILFLATHAVHIHPMPQFCYEFENAKVVFCDPDIPESENNILAIFHDGRTKAYGDPNKSDRVRKMWMAVDAIREKAEIVCGIEAASSHTVCINAAHESAGEIVNFPPDLTRRDEDRRINWVEGLKETFRQCFAENRLPSESGIPWAKPGKTIDTGGYDFFRG